MKPKTKPAVLPKWGNLALLAFVASIVTRGLAASQFRYGKPVEKIFTVSSKGLIDCDITPEDIFKHQINGTKRDIHELIKIQYKVMQFEECKIKRLLLETLLEKGLLDPNAFALKLIKKPGYMGIANGKSIEIWRCDSVKFHKEKKQENASEWNWETAFRNIMDIMSFIGGFLYAMIIIYLLAILIMNSVICGHTERSVWQGCRYFIIGVRKIPSDAIKLIWSL